MNALLTTVTRQDAVELSLLFIKEKTKAGCRWLIPVILATQEAEIRRISVQSQPRENSLQDPISKITITKKELVEWLKV
jgi:hypothetical protein